MTCHRTLVGYKTMINWVSLVLVMLSISLLTTQSHCAEDSPGLFYLVLVLSLLGYLCMAVLLILWLVVLFCLSGLVFVLEWFGVGPTVMQWQGATQEMLDGIPVIKFSKPVADSSETNTGSTQQQPSSTHQLKPPSPIPLSSVEKGVGGNTVAIDMEPTTNAISDRNIPKSLTDTMDVDTNAAAGVNTTIPQYAEENVQSGPVEALSLDNLTPDEQAQESSSLPMCSICLCEYEDLDTLRLLPCSHDFHKDCVDEWLRLKRTCPLCKQDISQFKPGNKFWSRRQRHNGGPSGEDPISLLLAEEDQQQQQQGHHEATSLDNNHSGFSQLPSFSSSLSSSSRTSIPSNHSAAPVSRMPCPSTADGVFSNIPAKPQVVTQKNVEARPPTYDSALQDVTPPYYEMAVVSPSVFGDEVLVDGLPIGSIFQFLWNVAVATSFQFLGVLLTYLLHNSHASKSGSMVGLGITLLALGIKMRGDFMYNESEHADGANQVNKPLLVDDTGYVAGVDPLYGSNADSAQMDWLQIDMENQWVSLFLMIIGWMIIIRTLAAYAVAIRTEKIINAQPTEEHQGYRTSIDTTSSEYSVS
ncbi:hypothetical protein BG011_009244 [Mortierella polycephala]|uniref:RING-type domain-containing protein n=1 Tax=Mortierella polycephala TaxID=41804 RepID=A0A9P6U810_9FUNG|nr:hypothetical protein BG011_009244 [Mortierella polycephala]